MIDGRFFHRAGPFSLGVLASHIKAEIPAGASEQFRVSGVATLEGASAGELSVFSDSSHREVFQRSRASVVVTSANLSRHALSGAWLLLTDNPRLAFAQIGRLFYPETALQPGSHPSACIDPTAEIGAGTQIGAGVVVRASVKIGEKCRIDSNAVIGCGVKIGDHCRIGTNTSVSHAIIGNRVRISSNVAIGSEGFGFVAGPEGLVRVPQLGRVVIEDGVEIGDNCAIDRGAMDDTLIGAGTAIDNLVQIAHNVRIGRYCVIAAQTGVAGSVTIGDFVMIGGQVAIKDHANVGSHARIAARGGVMRDVPPNASVAGAPAVPVREWHRQTLALKKMACRKME